MANSNFYANIGVNAGYSVSKNSNNFHVAGDVESQTIEYTTNPGKLKEDIGKTKGEIEVVGAVAKAAFNTIGSKEKNGFFFRIELEEKINKAKKIHKLL